MCAVSSKKVEYVNILAISCDMERLRKLPIVIHHAIMKKDHNVYRFRAPKLRHDFLKATSMKAFRSTNMFNVSTPIHVLLSVFLTVIIISTVSLLT